MSETVLKPLQRVKDKVLGVSDQVAAPSMDISNITKFLLLALAFIGARQIHIFIDSKLKELIPELQTNDRIFQFKAPFSEGYYVLTWGNVVAFIVMGVLFVILYRMKGIFRWIGFGFMSYMVTFELFEVLFGTIIGREGEVTNPLAAPKKTAFEQIADRIMDTTNL